MPMNKVLRDPSIIRSVAIKNVKKNILPVSLYLHQNEAFFETQIMLIISDKIN